MRKFTIAAACTLSSGSWNSSIHVNDAIGYAAAPGAFVIDTRKSAGMLAEASAAAAVTDAVDALMNAPAAFCTAP